MMRRKLILYIATSIDGYIAKPNDKLDFLSLVEKEGEDYGYKKFIDSVDTVIMGRRTYDWIMKQIPEFPHAGKETFIITRSEKASIGKTTFYTDDLTELVQQLKAKQGKNIFYDGGAQIVHELLQNDLIDEMILSVIPVLVGDGTRLFKDGRPEQIWKLISIKQYDTGLIQIHYTRDRN